MANVMIDIETFSSETNARVIQIGAVRFDLLDSTLREEFIVNVNPDDPENLKRDKSFSTMEFWREQPDKVRATWDVPERVSLRAALLQLSAFIKQSDIVWANSPSFDCAILRNAYKQLGIPCPWHYRAERDCRTVWMQLPIPGRKWVMDRMETIKRERPFLDHYALDDAKEQALGLQLEYIWQKTNTW